MSGYDDWTFAPETAFYTVKEQFKVASLDGFGLKDKTAAIGAAGGALHYLTQNLRRDVKHLTRISFYQRSDFLTLDYTTLRHLEILEPQHHDAPRNAWLYGALNKTVTPMGARLLRNGFRNRSPKWSRSAAVRMRCETFIKNSFGLDAFRQQLAQGPRSGTHTGPFEFRQRQCARSGRAATGAGADSGAETDFGNGGRERPREPEQLRNVTKMPRLARTPAPPA